MTMLDIRINTLGSTEWDAFVHTIPGATFAHLYAWKQVIEGEYGNPCYYFEAWSGTDLQGVLPTTYVASRLFGRQLVSVPYLDTGGPLYSTETAKDSLIAAAVEQAAKCGADVCLRSLESDLCAWPRQTSKVTMYLPLQSTPEETLKLFSSERRNRIKKALKNGLSVSFHKEDALEQFYAVFCENMRDLGSPVHSWSFFQRILVEFPGNSGILLVKDSAGKTIGAGLYFRFGNILALPWVSSLRDSFKLNPNIIMYWELIKWGCEAGAEIFDFGRSSLDSGTFEYKRQWGAEPVPLYWYLHSLSGTNSIEAIDSTSRKNQLMIDFWKKLPLTVANFIGPKLRKSISL